jgi:hypothetical protein
MQKDSIRNG